MTVLVRVNGNDSDLVEAMRRRMLHPNRDQLLDYCITELLLRQYATKNKISYTPSELEAGIRELDSQERENKTWKEFQAAIQGEDKFQYYRRDGVGGKLLRDKILTHFQEEDIQAYFAEHKLDFDKVELYSIRLGSKEQAEELYAQITEDGEDFHLLTRSYSQDEETKPQLGYVGKVSRSEVTAEIEAAVFNASPGEVVGPIKTESGYNLFKVGAVYPATLEEERENIRLQLFSDLIARLRAEAKITYPILTV